MGVARNVIEEALGRRDGGDRERSEASERSGESDEQQCAARHRRASVVVTRVLVSACSFEVRKVRSRVDICLLESGETLRVFVVTGGCIYEASTNNNNACFESEVR